MKNAQSFRLTSRGGRLLSFLLSSIAVTCHAGSCKPDASKNLMLSQETLPAVCLNDPGWFDVGAGFAFIRRAGGENQDGKGILVTLRAYPFGRWYASSITATKETVLAKAAASSSLEVSSATTAEKAQAHTDYVASVSEFLQNNQAVFAVKEYQEGNAFESIIRRVSVFYGRSVGGFDSKAVSGDVNAVGLSFDIAPQFSLIWGRAFFDGAVPTGSSAQAPSRRANIVGVQLNLYAFKTFRDLVGSN